MNGTHIDYIEVQIVALLVYLFLYCSFLGKTKDQAIKRLRMFLISCLMWVGGSLCMRLQLFPGMKCWYHVSLAGLVLMIGSVMELTSILLGIYGKKESRTYYLIVTILFAINVVTESILAPPKVIMTENGIQYTYNISKELLYGVIPLFGMILLFAGRVAQLWRNEREKIYRIRMLILAFVVIIIGNLMMLIPAVTFPCDVASGILAAILLVIMLYQRHVFLISERMSVGLIYTVSFLIAFLPIFLGYSGSPKGGNGFGSGRFAGKYEGYMLISGIWIMLVSVIAGIFHNYYINRRERQIHDIISAFQNEANRMPDVEHICEELLKAIMKMTESDGAIVDLRNERKGLPSTYGAGMLEGKTVDQNDTFEFLQYVLQQEECFFATDSVTLESFEKEKGLRDWLTERDFGGIGCLENDSEMMGYVFVHENSQYPITREREQELSVLCYAAASALRNAILYEKIYQESVTDELTGIGNRKYVIKQLEEIEAREKSCGFLYLDIDDFKMYNEIYGMAEGDLLLKRCAEIIQEVMPEGSKIGRYAADEFFVIVENTTAEDILTYGKKVLRVLAEETNNSEKHIHYVSMSGGISMYPEMASTTKKAMQWAGQAMAQAKTHGRNRINIYNQNTENPEKNAYEEVASTIYALTAAIDAKDSVTFRHVQNVSKYAVSLARALGYSDENIEIVRQAALLHDIGKISIPEDILKKKGSLTEEEYEIIKSHVVNSIDIIQFLPGMDYVIPAVIGHHERYDGKGYPRGIAGEEIPAAARILTIADSFDAMTAERTYKKSLPAEYALEELKRCKGTQFDPKMAEVFIELVENGEII